jgi:hypothetical protein
MKRNNRTSIGVGLCVVLLAVALVAPAAAQTVTKGSDPWFTRGDGTSNAQLNLPLDYFGPGCTFQGTVALKGVPVASTPANAFGNGDTIVERLDDAVFDASGNATVRIAVRSLRFRTTQDLVTPCGTWKAEVKLNNPQALTRMTLKRAGTAGGTFTAPISVATNWVFTNNSTGQVLTLPKFNTLDSPTPIPWKYGSCPGEARTSGPVTVDTNGDGTPDTVINGTSNVAAGYDASCALFKPCRNKNVDPATHCYEGASAIIIVDPGPDPVPVDPVPIEH